MDTFFSGMHLNENDFGQNFEQMPNQRIEFIHQLEQKQRRDKVWYNEDVQLRELGNVIIKHHITACSFNENNFFYPTMIVRSGPKFRRCPVNRFSSCLTNSQRSGFESRILLIRKPSKPDYTDPLHIDPSA